MIHAGRTRKAESVERLPAGLSHVPIKWQQGEDDFCVPYGLANALDAAGFTKDAVRIAELAGMIASRKGDPVARLATFVNGNLKLWNAVVVGSGVCDALPLHFGLPEPEALPEYPCLLQLLDSSGDAGHSVGLFNRVIYDAVEPTGMRLSRLALDQSSSPHYYRSIYRMLVMVPKTTQIVTVNRIMQKTRT